jgi:hypothetical protein
MKFEIQLILNGYLVIEQTEPQAGELVLHVSEVDFFCNELRKAGFNYSKMIPKDWNQLPPPALKKIKN